MQICLCLFSTDITVSLSSDKINVTESTNYVNITYEHYGLISEPVIVIFTAFAGSATGKLMTGYSIE